MSVQTVVYKFVLLGSVLKAFHFLPWRGFPVTSYEIMSRGEFTFHPGGSGIIKGDLKVMLKLRRSEPHDSIRDLGVTPPKGDQDPPGGV